jgi:hypothetical protein
MGVLCHKVDPIRTRGSSRARVLMSVYVGTCCRARYERFIER